MDCHLSRVSDNNENENTNRNDNNGPDVQEPAPAPEPAPAVKSMTIKFRDQSNNEVSFKMKPTTMLKKAMDAFSARTERDAASLRFVLDGQRVLNENTPADLEMEDGDTIDVFTEQIGGSEVAGEGNDCIDLQGMAETLELPAQASAASMTINM